MVVRDKIVLIRCWANISLTFGRPSGLSNLHNYQTTKTSICFLHICRNLRTLRNSRDNRAGLRVMWLSLSPQATLTIPVDQNIGLNCFLWVLPTQKKREANNIGLTIAGTLLAAYVRWGGNAKCHQLINQRPLSIP